MNNGNIKIVNFEMLHITSCEYEKNINSYGMAKIKGYIDEKDYEECKRKAYSGECFVVEEIIDSNSQVIFSGIVKSVSFYCDKGYNVNMVLQGELSKLNLCVNNRIFQNDNNSLYDMISKIAETNEVQYRVRNLGTTNISHMVVQYEESDWDFLIRIIKEVGGCLIPDYKGDGCRFFIGLKEGEKEILSSEKYVINSLYHEYEKKVENGIKQVIDDQFEYVIKADKYFELGDAVEFNGKLLYVYRIEGKWEGQELIHHYVLRTKGAFKQLSIQNYNLSGVTFSAKVSKINHDKIEVSFDDVEAYGSREYIYSTVYSSANGAGWYCMPEVDDKVTITFATQNPESAYASGAVHLSMGEKDSDTKFIRNPYDKEIRFTKDELKITNNRGTEIILNDTNGLTLTSAGAINITAEKDITISSTEERITLQGETGVELKQSDSKVIVNGDVMLIGEQIHIQNVE